MSNIYEAEMEKARQARAEMDAIDKEKAYFNNCRLGKYPSVSPSETAGQALRGNFPQARDYGREANEWNMAAQQQCNRVSLSDLADQILGNLEATEQILSQIRGELFGENSAKGELGGKSPCGIDGRLQAAASISKALAEEANSIKSRL